MIRIYRTIGASLMAWGILFLAMTVAHAAPTLNVSSVSGDPGSQVSFPVNFDPGGAQVASLQFNLVLPPAISTVSFSAGQSASSAGKLIGTGVNGSSWTFLVWGLNQTTMPPGVVVNVTMRIKAGTPGGPQPIAITLPVFADPNATAIQAGPCSGSIITVNGVVLPAPQITSALTANGTANSPFTYTISATNSPTSFSAVGLPAGLTLNPLTGLISGTPTAEISTSVTIRATNASGTGSASLILTINSVSPPPSGTSTAFIASKTLGTLRNNYGSWVGFKFTVGSTPLTINALGRIAVSGNTQAHPVKIVRVSDQGDVAGPVSIQPGGTPGQFNYVNLPSAVTLVPNTAYYIGSLETASGDYWHDFDSVVMPTSAGTIDSAAFHNGSYWQTYGGANRSYGPVDFKYGGSSTTPPPPPPPSGSTPYGGTAAAIPGRIEMERFDEGGEGVAYHDNDAGNIGGAFRTGGVDMTGTADTGGGTMVGWVGAGEWLKYTVNINQSGSYQIGVRVASSGNGGTFHIEQDGVDVTGPMTAPNTGGWDTWQTITKTATLSAGTHVLRVAMDQNGATGSIANFNYFEVTVGGSTTPPPSGTNTAFVASKTLGTLRNNYTGWVGFKFTVGNAPLTINSLGRIAVSGNTQAHNVKILRASDSVDVAGPVSIPVGGTPGQFTYTHLPSAITLAANTAYYIGSWENAGGDFWHDYDSVVTPTSAGAINSAAFYNGAYWQTYGGYTNRSYGPVDFTYTAAATGGTTPGTIYVSADNAYQVYLNGSLIGQGGNWQVAGVYSVNLNSGDNIVAIKGTDAGGVAAVLAEISANGQRIGSSNRWKVSKVEYAGWTLPGYNDSAWASASDYGAYGVAQPWAGVGPVSGMPAGTPARWIWSNNNDLDDVVYLRLKVTLSGGVITASTLDSGTGLDIVTVNAPMALSAARAYPNPWRVDRAPRQEITFDQMSDNTTVKIFTIAGHWVRTLHAPAGAVSWDLRTDAGDPVASGLYVYLLVNPQGDKVKGKLAVIR